ncbi:unnamed protein product [Lactuca saligna]|uniref:Uncharacterized protein n=1 Tax=Lactuca saligna TaxID=75948 RepID=A0AA35YP33_LACSI|nr:unnamed protein product [Lactuca saligna]
MRTSIPIIADTKLRRFLRGDMLNYGLGLTSCYSITDLPSVVSGGFLYMFDPCGKAFTLPSSSHSPVANMFTLTDLH